MDRQRSVLVRPQQDLQPAVPYMLGNLMESSRVTPRPSIAEATAAHGVDCPSTPCPPACRLTCSTVIRCWPLAAVTVKSRKQLGGGPGAGREVIERLDDLGALRIREMDEAGIDLQVLSHSIPGLQAVDAEAGAPLRAAPMTGYMRRCSAIGIVFLPLPCCRPPIRGLRPTNWSVLSPGSGSRAQ